MIHGLPKSRHEFPSLAALLGLILLLGGARASPAAGLPTNVCLGDFCGPAQRDLWTRFQHGRGLHGQAIPSVYSGICYVNADRLNPDRRHFVGLLIDEVRGELSLGLRFSFFSDRQPYAGLSVETARRRFSEPMAMTLHDGFAYAEVDRSKGPYRYWARQDADSDGRLLLVGYFGFDYTLLCDLVNHHASS